jgi:hypothetical protein
MIWIRCVQDRVRLRMEDDFVSTSFLDYVLGPGMAREWTVLLLPSCRPMVELD